MENGTSRELLDNVAIPDVNGSQFIMQRMDNTQLLTADLLQHHNGIVVDLGGGDYIPVNYTSEDLLSQDLTEEDRNLAAALVAVQLSQQQKQQQLQHDSAIMNGSLPPLVSNSGLVKPSTGINGNYLQIVDTDSVYKQVSKLIDDRDFDDEEVYDRPETLIIKSEEELEQSTLGHRDSDGDTRTDVRTSKKILPHKKRISRKLKKNCNSSRKLQKCHLCDQIFNSADEYLQHRQICETTITPINVSVPFTCQICSAVFHDQLEFFQHLKSHYEPTHIQIPTTNSIDPLKLNTTSQCKSDNQFSCYKCSKTFRKQENLEAHLKLYHKSTGGGSSSKVDMNEFSETEDLMEGIHVNTGGNPGEDDSKAWYREDELHATEEDLRELEAQEHVCQVCKQEFASRAVLKDHSAMCGKSQNQEKLSNSTSMTQQNGTTKTKGDKKNNVYNCTLCDKVFIYKNSLVYHMRGHTGTRPHHCDQCVKSFYSSSALKIHLRMHTGDKPYKCEYCGKDFRQWGDLKYHCISIHSDQKQYKCEYCGKDFARKYSLVLHLRIHTGEKNYSCEYCGKSFRASTYLKNHIRIHTGEKPYSCDICGKKFRVSSDMKRHMKTHSRKRNSRATGQTGDVLSKTENSEVSDQVVMNMDEASKERLKEEADGVAQNIHYESDPLDSVRDTLYVMPILIT